MTFSPALNTFVTIINRLIECMNRFYGISTFKGLVYALAFGNHVVDVYIFLCSCFLSGFDTQLRDFKYSYQIQIICTQLYDWKYFYLIKIICTQLYHIKYSYLIQIIYTQLYYCKYSYLIQIICTQSYDTKYSKRS